MVLSKTKSKSITKQKQKQRQTVIVNIDTKKTRSKRQPRQSPRKPKAGNSEIATNPLYYPSVIHAAQQPPPYTMQPQEIKDAIREAIRNITHASTKDQYLEQLQHTNDLERQPKTKVENQPEANVEPPIQPELQPQMPDLQQPAPIANIDPISILAGPAPRERTPIETPKENESEIVQYVGKTREQVANDRPYLQPINFKKETFGFKSSDTKPFEGVGNIFNSPFVKLEKQTLKDKILQAAEERQRLSKQNEQLVVLGPEPPPVPEPLKPLPGWEDEPEPPPPPKEKKKHGIAQRLAEYDNPEIVRILTDYNLFDKADKGKHRQTLIYKYSNLLEGKRVKWKNYTKSTK